MHLPLEGNDARRRTIEVRIISWMDRKKPPAISRRPSRVKDRTNKTQSEPSLGPIALSAKDVIPSQVDPDAQQLFVRIQNYRREKQLHRYPPLLYHYTNVTGLIGIVERNALWATHVNYLNDSSEVVYASELVREALHQRELETDSSVVKEFLKRAETTFNLTDVHGVYVVCLCEEGDLLSQWRAYAQGGEGYAIGIDAEKFAWFGGYGAEFFFGKVEYDPKTQTEIVNTIISMVIGGLLDLIGRSPRNEADARINQCCWVLQQSLWYSLATFKSPLFASEKEWRAIRLVPPEQGLRAIKFRSSGSKLIPYLELDFGRLVTGAHKLPIRHVFHGPTLDADLTKACARMLLAKHDYASVDVLGSKVPLRK